MTALPTGTTPRPLRFGIIGAGAIGGLIAARLALAGHPVAVLARGATLAAIRAEGLLLETEDGPRRADVDASDDPAALGPQDVLIVAVKAFSVGDVLDAVAAMSHRDTRVLPAQNGIPWWFFLDDSVRLAGTRLPEVDPGGRIETALPLDRVVGIVTYVGAHRPAPNRIRATGGRLAIGMPFRAAADRLADLAAALDGAGFQLAVVDDVRREAWMKLLGNVCFNPVSLLTASDNGHLLGDDRVRETMLGLMAEVIDLGRAIGLAIDVDPVERLAQAQRHVGNVKTSMLQDLLAARRVEIDAIVGATVRIADGIGAPAPRLRTIHALARLRATLLGLYP